MRVRAYSLISGGVIVVLLMAVAFFSRGGIPKAEATSMAIGRVLDVATDGTYAYLVTVDNGLIVANVQNPSAPDPVISLDNTALGIMPREISKSGNLLALTDRYRQNAVIVDVAIPAAPSKKSTLSLATGSAGYITLAGQSAYVVNSVNGGAIKLKIYNLSNPSSPSLVSDTLTVPFTHSMAVIGGYAYLNVDAGIAVVNVSTPTNPTLVNTLSYSSSGAFIVGSATNLYTAAYYDYVNGAPGFKIASLSNPASPSWQGQSNFNTPTAGPQGLAVQNNYLYVSTDYGYLEIYNVTSATNPTFVAKVAYPWTYGFGLAVSGRYVYVANDVNGGLLVIDVNSATNPSNPTIVGSLKDPAVISIQADKTTANRGDTITYTITYANGPTARTNAKIDFSIPGGTTYVANSACIVTNNACSTHLTDASDGDVFTLSGSPGNWGEWKFTTLNANQAGNLSLQVTVQ